MLVCQAPRSPALRHARQGRLVARTGPPQDALAGPRLHRRLHEPPGRLGLLHLRRLHRMVRCLLPHNVALLILRKVAW